MTEKERRVKIFSATDDFLMDLIKECATNLPEDTYVIAVQYDFAKASFEFKVASSEFEEVSEGHSIPYIVPAMQMPLRF